MRRHEGDVHGIPRLHGERLAGVAEFLAPRQIAMAAGMEAFMLDRRRVTLVVGRQYGHDLAAPDLQEDVVFGIEMEGRGRPGRGDEDETLQLQHLAGARADDALQRRQRLLQQLAI